MARGMPVVTSPCGFQWSGVEWSGLFRDVNPTEPSNRPDNCENKTYGPVAPVHQMRKPAPKGRFHFRAVQSADQQTETNPVRRNKEDERQECDQMVTRQPHGVRLRFEDRAADQLV